MNPPTPSSAPTPAPARRRRRLRLAIVLALLVAGIAIAGSIRTPTGPLEVKPAGNVRLSDSRVLRIASYNIHSGIGADGRLDLARTAADLRGFDLVGLNEVRGAFSAGQDQASQLAGLLNARAVFAPHERRWFHEHFGNGLLHRIDISGHERIPLDGSWGRGRRNVVRTRILTPGGAVNVLLTHIDRGADRPRQLGTVRKMFLGLSEPAILMGDMNSEKTDPLIQPLLTSPGVTDGIAQTLGNKDPADRIDYILTRGLKWRNGGLGDSKASDHPMAWGEVEVP